MWRVSLGWLYYGRRVPGEGACGRLADRGREGRACSCRLAGHVGGVPGGHLILWRVDGALGALLCWAVGGGVGWSKQLRAEQREMVPRGQSAAGGTGGAPLRRRVCELRKLLAGLGSALAVADLRASRTVCGCCQSGIDHLGGCEGALLGCMVVVSSSPPCGWGKQCGVGAPFAHVSQAGAAKPA